MNQDILKSGLLLKIVVGSVLLGGATVIITSSSKPTTQKPKLAVTQKLSSNFFAPPQDIALKVSAKSKRLRAWDSKTESLINVSAPSEEEVIPSPSSQEPSTSLSPSPTVPLSEGGVGSDSTGDVTATPSPTSFVLSPSPSVIVSPSISPIASPVPSDEGVSPSPTSVALSPTPEINIASESATLAMVELKKDSKDVNKKLEYAENRVIVKFKDVFTASAQTQSSNVYAFAEKYDMETQSTVPDMKMAVIDTGDKTVEQAVQELKSNPMVSIVEPDYTRHISATTPNDSYFSTQWALHNTGQTINSKTGTADKDMDAPEAWDSETSAQTDIIVAVIDSGVSIKHPDLIGNMWNGSSCKDINNQVISGGCPNNGWDFLNGDNDPSDDNGHGTHVAGIIAATSANSKGISGTSNKNNIKIMALKVGGPTGTISTSAVINAINFAKNNGAKVINASFGGGRYSQIEKDVISAFPGLFIVAAGNDGTNNDSSPTYPCNYATSNSICVAATDQNDALASFSNYGASSVGVAAPGVNIRSTYISRTSLSNQSFDATTPPTLPSGWTKNTSSSVGMGTINSASGDKFLIGDINYSQGGYGVGKDYQAASGIINTSGYTTGYMSMFVQCDTEYEHGDTLIVYVSKDGGNTYTALTQFDEPWIRESGGGYDGTFAYGVFDGITIPSSYLTNNFKYMFRWYTDADLNKGQGYGCFVDDVIVYGISNSGEYYDYLSGTSMATPYVSGLAGMVMSKDSLISTAVAKNIVLDTGDPIAALSGKVSSGKRINLQGAAGMNTNQKNLDTVFYYPWYDDSDITYVREAWVLVANQSATQSADVRVYFKGVLRYSGMIPPGQSVTPQFDEEVGGPVKVESVNGVSIYSSERARLAQSFNETFGFPNKNLTTTYYYPYYDDSDQGGNTREAWVLVANPSASQTANVDIYFKGAKRWSGQVAPGTSVTPQFDEEVGGPVKVVSTNGVNIYSSQRVRHNSSFNEMFGYPENQVTTTYYFPWYDDSDGGGYTREAFVAVGNQSSTQTANVSYYYKGNLRYSRQIAPKGTLLMQFDEEVGGPVKVVSTNGVPIYTSERVTLDATFNETMGYPENQMTTVYYYPWYDDSDNSFVREAWVLLANPSASQTANVDIYYRGLKRWTGTVAPGSSVTPQFDEEVGGPVKVVSTNGVNIYSSERVRFGNSFNEIFGM